MPILDPLRYVRITRKGAKAEPNFQVQDLEKYPRENATVLGRFGDLTDELADTFGLEVPSPIEAEFEFIGNSACVRAIKFDRHTGIGDLSVQFEKGGSIYTYHDVQNLMYFNFLTVKSKGWYFNRYIRNNYEYTQES